MKHSDWSAGTPQGTAGRRARHLVLAGTTGMPYAGAFAHRQVCISAVKASQDANGTTGRPMAPPGGWSG